LKLITPKSAVNNSNIIDTRVHNRTILAIGEDNVKRNSQTHVAVPATGGLGIIVIELLGQLGVKNFTIGDFDWIEYSNLNRFLGASRLDARLKTKKTAVAARLLYDIDPEINVNIVEGNFLDKEIQEKYSDCDILISCFDTVAPRLAASYFCLAKGIPHLDLGCVIKVEDDKMTACCGQVVKIIPGDGFCIKCCGLFDIEKANIELSNPEEAERLKEMGYVEGADIKQPSVSPLNMIVAAQAVWIYSRLVAGEKLDFDGIYVDALNFQTYPWSEKDKRAKRSENLCPICGKGGIEFCGDDVSLLVREKISDLNIPENKAEKKIEPSNNIKEEGEDNGTLQHTSDKE